MLTTCIERMERKHSVDALIYATHIWKRYITDNIDTLKSINRNQAEALSVVLEYLSANAVNEDVSVDALCEMYSISITRFENALKKLSEYAIDGVEV